MDETFLQKNHTHDIMVRFARTIAKNNAGNELLQVARSERITTVFELDGLIIVLCSEKSKNKSFMLFM